MAKGGKLRKARSNHAIPSPAATQAAKVSTTAPSVTGATTAPIALTSGSTTKAEVTSDAIPPSSSTFNVLGVGSVGSVASSAAGGEMSHTPTPAWAKPNKARSIRSVSSGHDHDDHTPPSIASQTTTTDSSLPTSTSASALSQLRERLSADEAARKHQLEQEAEAAAGPRKLQKKRQPSETSTPTEPIKEEPVTLLPTVDAELEEDDSKVTEMGGAPPLGDEAVVDGGAEDGQLKAEKSVRDLYRLGWIPSSYIPSPAQVVNYATGTVKSTTYAAFDVATFVPFAVARRVPIVRGYVPARTADKPTTKKEDEAKVTTDPDLGEIAATEPDLFTAPSEGEKKAGLAYKSLEVGLGLGIATVLVGVAGAELAYQKVWSWRKKGGEPVAKAIH